MQKWNEELYLFTVDEYNQLPDGTELISVNGDTRVKGCSYIDQDTRFGYIAYGVKDPWNHALKDLFMMFLLKN